MRLFGLADVIEAATGKGAARAAVEIGLVAGAFLLYFLVRGSVIRRDEEALRNALDIIEVEKKLGCFWEPALNRAILYRPLLIRFFNQVYFWFHFPAVVATGLWLYFSGRHRHYTLARDALLASGAIALVVYHRYPVMPPRLLPPETGYRFVDTVEQYSRLSYQAQEAEPFVNPYAAVPSLHFGWNVLVGGVLIRATDNVWLQAFGVFLPVSQLVSIVVTANHYILDAVAGLAVALAGLLVALGLQRWGYPAAARLPRPAPERLPPPASS